MRLTHATVVIALLGAGCDGGCSRDEQRRPETGAAPSPEAPATVDEAADPDPEPEPESLARVVSGWDRGRAVDTETLEVPADGEPLVLDLRDGARITLDPGTVAALGEEAPAQVLLGKGALHAQLPPMGGSTRPSLRVGTPMGSLVIDASGESYVVVAPDGRVVFSQLAGLGRIYDGELDSRGRPTSLPLRPGRSLAGGASDPTEGPSNVSAARGLREPMAAGGRDAPQDSEVRRREQAVDRFADEVLRERERGQQLQRDRLGAAREAPDDRSADLQRQLIAHSQVVSRQREALRARYERLRSLGLLLGQDPDGARRERVRMLLGLTIPQPVDEAPSPQTEGSAQSDDPAPAQN